MYLGYISGNSKFGQKAGTKEFLKTEELTKKQISKCRSKPNMSIITIKVV